MSRDLTDPLYRAVGIRQTLKAILSDRAETVYLADDADDGMLEEIRHEALARRIPVEPVSSMKLLGKRCRIEVAAAAAAKLRADNKDYEFPGVVGIL